MSKADEKRRACAQAVAKYFLEEGLADNSIRTLAEAAGTSDRMLIYYFGSKDALIGESLSLIAGSLSDALDQQVGAGIHSASALLEAVTTATKQPVFDRVVRLWFEIVGQAVRGKEPFATQGRLVADRWIAWIESRLPPRQRHSARELFATLEGRLLLEVLAEKA
ncbi:MAG: TetR/AcrR family transcriptional regulator [Pseudomonadota bacterium]